MLNKQREQLFLKRRKQQKESCKRKNESMIELRKGRFELNLNQLQVVSLAGCSKGSISMYLNDKNIHLEQSRSGLQHGTLKFGMAVKMSGQWTVITKQKFEEITGIKTKYERMDKHMKGYKVFNSDWTCRGFQFKVGKVFEEDVSPACCDRGFHFCTKASDCFSYYSFDPDNKVAEVEALGDIDTQGDDSKCCTNKIHIIREITWQEVLDLVNLGKACTGLGNTGDCNSGNHNTGDCNTGDCNSGNHNTGDCNTGDHNSGNHNSGHWNSGDCNSGNRNIGDRNSGNWNSGDYNTGDCNTGNCNTGNYNTGNYNSGNHNSGNHNSGNHNRGYNNSGNWNSGNRNSGNWNSGDWNKTCFSNGCFNTELPKIFLFNKPSDWTFKDWLNSKARYILMDCPSNVLSWIWEYNMTDEEKEQHHEYSVTDGFLKHIEEETGRQMWWDGLSDRKKTIVMNLPNFDKYIFKEITGIDVEG
jgi:hypothetical protein